MKKTHVAAVVQTEVVPYSGRSLVSIGGCGSFVRTETSRSWVQIPPAALYSTTHRINSIFLLFIREQGRKTLFQNSAESRLLILRFVRTMTLVRWPALNESKATISYDRNCRRNKNTWRRRYHTPRPFGFQASPTDFPRLFKWLWDIVQLFDASTIFSGHFYRGSID